jgi:hypothetical protein
MVICFVVINPFSESLLESRIKPRAVVVEDAFAYP